MLDEIAEREQYTYDIARYARLKDNSETDKWFKRLKFDNITNDLSGIERAMIIVARGFLMDNAKEFGLKDFVRSKGTGELPKENRKQAVICTRECLRSWCGLCNTTTSFMLMDYEKQNGTALQKWQRCEEWRLREKTISTIETCTGLLKVQINNDNSIDDFVAEHMEYKGCSKCGKKDKYIYIKEKINSWLPNYLFYILASEKKERLLNALTDKSKNMVNTFFREYEKKYTNTTSDDEQDKPEHELAQLFNSVKKELLLEEKDLNKLSALTNVLSTIEKLRWKKSQFARPMFLMPFEDGKHNDTKKLTYDSIIASAMNSGPLNSFYLIAKKTVQREDLMKQIKALKVSMDDVQDRFNNKEFTQKRKTEQLGKAKETWEILLSAINAQAKIDYKHIEENSIVYKQEKCFPIDNDLIDSLENNTAIRIGSKFIDFRILAPYKKRYPIKTVVNNMRAYNREYNMQLNLNNYYFKPIFVLDSKKTVNEKDLVNTSKATCYALVAAYLLYKKNNTGKFVVFNKTDFSNWRHCSKPGKDILNNLVYTNTSSGSQDVKEKLIEQREFDNIIKLKVHPDWIEHCGFEVIEKDKYTEETYKDYIIVLEDDKQPQEITNGDGQND